MPGPAPRFSRTPPGAGPVAPVGGATAELLAEVGYDDGELAELREANVIA
jgi:crotonobetainyl-CoA:carnitine CoA-transferase CaiB-like acyl-CoA transferase